jgi:hypothetical protein
MFRFRNNSKLTSRFLSPHASMSACAWAIASTEPTVSKTTKAGGPSITCIGNPRMLDPPAFFKETKTTSKRSPGEARPLRRSSKRVRLCPQPSRTLTKSLGFLPSHFTVVLTTPLAIAESTACAADKTSVRRPGPEVVNAPSEPSSALVMVLEDILLNKSRSMESV